MTRSPIDQWIVTGAVLAPTIELKTAKKFKATPETVRTIMKVYIITNGNYDVTKKELRVFFPKVTTQWSKLKRLVDEGFMSVKERDDIKKAEVNRYHITGKGLTLIQYYFAQVRAMVDRVG